MHSVSPHANHPHAGEKPNLLRQPMAVWAVAFACIIAFMGIGLVDPILKSIAEELHASKSQVELLFTSYNLIMGVAMLITGWTSSRIGYKWTLLSGLLLIVIFSALCGTSGTIAQIAWFRAGWGLGNALFIATALAVIVAVASGGTAGAIILYEAALGLGISVGPLLGGELGSISWRGPFFGVSVLMAIAFVAVSALLRGVPKPKRKSAVTEPIRALGHGGLFTMGITAFFYNFGFFTLLGFAPFVLDMNVHQLGYVFFGWGIMLAITSVFVAPRLQGVFGTVPTMCGVLLLFAIDLLSMGIFQSDKAWLALAVILAGAVLGINNTLITTAVMEVSPFERPVASAAYSFIRFIGGGIAPWLAGKLAEWFNPQIPFYVGGVAVMVGVLILFSRRGQLRDV